MTDIAKWFINWLTLGPFKGIRTKVIALILFVLAGLKGTGHLAIPSRGIGKPDRRAVAALFTVGE